MTIHVNIGEAETRLSELVAAAMRGEEVVVAKAGEPQVRLVPIVAADVADAKNARRVAKRRSALGMYSHLEGDWEIFDRPSMTADQIDERERRKFGPPA